MRRLFLVFVVLLNNGVEANEVIATGYGASVELALLNAKTVAIEQIAGTFVTGRTTVTEDHYRSRIEQYHGGVIRGYQVLTVEQRDGLISVRIQADVDSEKINTVIADRGADVSIATTRQLTDAADEFERTGRIVAALDDPHQAFAIRITDIRYRNRGPLTDIEIDAQVTLNPKWYDDVKTMAKNMGRKIDTGSGWADVLWGLSALSAIVNPMLPGTINHLARVSEKASQPSPEYAACFGREVGRDIDECYEILHPLERLTHQERWAIELVQVEDQWEKKIGRYPLNIRNQLLVEVSQGTNLYFMSSARERRFENPSVLLFEQSMMPFKYALTLPTADLRKITSFRMALAETPQMNKKNPSTAQR